MEVITLSGKLHGPCELRKDKNGNNYIRFRVYCTSKDSSGKERYTMYRCYCYDTTHKDLQDGDLVFLTGDLTIITRTDENGKTWVVTDVYVKNMAKGC